jgi:CRISPR/Cas system-associated protein Cas10 (large subunit of type III CRISPR-Cas system)
MSQDDEFMQKAMERMEKLEPLLDKIRTKYRGRDMHGHATCPICGVKGALTVSHSKRKGHIHAFCTTEGCVRMME